MNADQRKAFDAVVNGSNILLTGSAGSGKSFTIHHIMNWARDKNMNAAVTASTGCAAYLINGRTVHSFLGIGLAKKSAAELFDYVKNKKRPVLQRLRDLDLLIIDEISMIESALLTKISVFLGLIRRSSTPFGGIQIVLSGDFAQLPPVIGGYCFNSPEWKRAQIKTMKLNVIMRQDKDMKLKAILEEVRWGKCSPETLEELKNLRNTKFAHGIVPTILYSTNVNVDLVNNSKFQKLIEGGAPSHTYKTTYSQGPNQRVVKEWADSIKIPEETVLCEGAQVVITWNISQDDGLINGSRGVVTAVGSKGVEVKFTSGKSFVIEPFKILQDDDPHAWTAFMPLKLAYALTIHKSQGMTLDAIVLDLGKTIFENGQAYTALSRARDMASIRILDVVASSFKTHKEVLEFYELSELFES